MTFQTVVPKREVQQRKPHIVVSLFAKPSGNIAIFGCLILDLFDPPLSAQAMKKIPLPFSPIGINCLPWLVVAKEARIYEKDGIDVQRSCFHRRLLSAVSGDAVSGQQHVRSGGPAIISNVCKAANIIHVTAMVPRFTQSIMVKPEIKKPRI